MSCSGDEPSLNWRAQQGEDEFDVVRGGPNPGKVELRRLKSLDDGEHRLLASKPLLTDIDDLFGHQRSTRWSMASRADRWIAGETPAATGSGGCSHNQRSVPRWPHVGQSSVPISFPMPNSKRASTGSPHPSPTLARAISSAGRD